MTRRTVGTAMLIGFIAGLLAAAITFVVNEANAAPSYLPPAWTAKKPLVCFPADRWGPAPDADRPCVYRLYEDGSVVVKQRDGGRVAADD